LVLVTALPQHWRPTLAVTCRLSLFKSKSIKLCAELARHSGLPWQTAQSATTIIRILKTTGIVLL
jgi:hypothetical protein